MAKIKANTHDADDEADDRLSTPWFERIVSTLLCRGDLMNRKLEAQPVSLFELYRYATKIDAFLLIAGVACAVINGVAQPVLSLFAGRTTNVLLAIQPSSSDFTTEAYLNVYIMLGLAGLTTITNFVQYITFASVCTRVTARFKAHYVSSVIRQNAAWIDSTHSGELSAKLSDDLERIREGIGDKFGLLLRGVAMFLTGVIISFIYDWRIALLTFSISFMLCMCTALLSRRMNILIPKELAGIGQAGAVAEEAIMGVKTVQACNGQTYMVSRYIDALKSGMRYSIQKGIWAGFFVGMIFFCCFITMGAGYLYGGYLYNVGAVDNAGTVFIVNLTMLMGAYYLCVFAPHLIALLNARVAAAKLYEIIDRNPLISYQSNLDSQIGNVKGTVTFKNVDFSYPTRPDNPVLRNFSLNIKAGETIALVGHSGSGKSTTVGLLARLYDVTKGSIFIDEYNIQDVSLQQLRSIIGIVQQEPVLFNASIEGNVKMGNPEMSSAQVIAVCKQANAHDFISRLSEGYQTLIGNGGIQLSGGQKQRIAIARTLAKDPKILILDEATSALDFRSERKVQASLEAFSGRTTLIIAHRLSTVKRADKIMVLEAGCVVEQGTHSELMESRGKYYNLVEAQGLRDDDENEDHDDDEIIEEQRFRSKYTRRRLVSQSTIDSAHSGRDAFIRGASFSESYGVSSRASVRYRPDEIPISESASSDSSCSEKKQRRYGYIDILLRLKSDRWNIVLAIIITIIRSGELPGMALAWGYVFEVFEMERSEQMRHFGYSMAIFVALGVGTWLLHFVASVFYTRLAENAALTFRVDALRQILWQDAAYFDLDSHAPGRLISRLASDAPNIKAVMDGRMLQSAVGVFGIIGCFAVGFGYAYEVALIGTGVILFLWLFMIFMGFFVMRLNEKLTRNDDTSKLAIEIIENVKTIQLLGCEILFMERLESATKAYRARELHKCWYEATSYTASQSITYFVHALAFLVGVRVVAVGRKTPSQVYNAISAMITGVLAAQNSYPFFPEFVKARTAAQMLFSICDRVPATGYPYIGTAATLKGSIRFDRVNFSYPARKRGTVINDLSTEISSGSNIAIVGPSGSGKTTLFSLIERFYECDKGELLIDNVSLKEYCLMNLRSQIGFVGQEPVLFSGTVRQNVCLGLDSVPVEDVLKALEKANAYDFVAQMPSGIETEVGERGSQLSGGQKQRIAIARALIRNPKILLLDEATSALDAASEKVVQDALDKAKTGRTCLTIAHRLSSVQNADQILYLAGGKVREFGSHDELMAKRGEYYRLAKAVLANT